MKKIILLTVLFFGVMFGCKEEQFAPDAVDEGQLEPFSKKEINAVINDALQTQGKFLWSMTETKVLWSALVQSDQILSIGYKPVSEKGDVSGRLHEINVRASEWEASKTEILGVTVTELQRNVDREITEGDILLADDDILPIIEVRVSDLKTLEALRKMENIRYMEPLGYSMEDEGANGRTEDNVFGCGNAPENNLPASEYVNVAPGSKVPWNYATMNIQQAWQLSTGDNVGIAIIDTGTSPDQAGLNGAFNNGFSQGRSVHRFGTYKSSIWPWASPDGPDDRCGHGTAMSGAALAPRSGSGAAVGVAYNADLVSIRGTSDVLLSNSRERNGVADALKLAADRSDVKIISMSIGEVFSNSKVSDAVKYAYGKGKLIFSAAGTSTSFTNWVGVIFPANMNETVAVTGIKSGGGYNRCGNCHSGSKVDFTVVMERNDRFVPTLAQSGNVPSTVGGSSVATATVAGIAALVWSKNPGFTRAQVLEKLKDASDLYPSRNSNFGWGNIDALEAVQ